MDKGLVLGLSAFYRCFQALGTGVPELYFDFVTILLSSALVVLRESIPGNEESSMDQPSPPLNIEQRLDKSSATRMYWSLAVMATLGGFLFGYDTSNIGSALTFIPYHLGSLVLGYLVAGASLGAAVGAIASGSATDRWGRKSLLVVDAAIYATGAILSALTVNVAMLLIARTFIGLAVGADSAIATSYIAEFAPKDRRGRLAILQQWMITVGIFAAYLVAIIVFETWPQLARTMDWRLTLGLGAVPALIGLVYRTTMPESPRWLLQKGHYDRLHKTLQVLGVNASMDEIEQLGHKQEHLAGIKVKLTSGVKRALIIVSVFMVFQQITGINVPFYYGPKILSHFFGGTHGGLVSSTVDGITATLILAAVNIAATYIGFRYVDSAGRKYLARFGYGGMAVFITASATAMLTMRGQLEVVVLLICLSGFIVFFAFGVGGIGWIIQGEYFPTQVRGRMAATAAFVDWIANFAIIELFPLMDEHIGLPAVMLIFAVLSVLAVLFVSRWMPETKGLSLEEITMLFNKEAEASEH